MNNFSFFCNKECEYFPCHATTDPDSFNCLFCYCPLYTLGEKCGGNYSYTKSGIKNCEKCLLPHSRDGFRYIRSKFSEISSLATAGQSKHGVMKIVCLDLEGILIPEIWVAFADICGIPALKRTTRDEPDYDKLMQYRLDILRTHGLCLKDIQTAIAGISPLPGAKEFLGKLRGVAQVVIVSDTFEQFMPPIGEKLGWSTVLCNKLDVAEGGQITGYQMRCQHSKLTTVKALQSIGYETIAVGDSYNDLDMIRASKAGFLLNPPETIKSEHHEIPVYEQYDDLLAAIIDALSR